MFIGIDVGGSFIKAVLVDRSAKTLSSGSLPTPPKPADIEIAILNLMESLATRASVSKIDIQYACIGCAGTIDRQKRRVVISPNIPLLKNYPLTQNIEKKTGITVILENDATVALMGSWWKGHGSRYKNWLLVNIGSGIGGGAIIDNKVYQGFQGNSMEIGHMSIDYNGIPCACGSLGCLERYVSAGALVEYAVSAIESDASSSLSSLSDQGLLTAESIYEAAIKKEAPALKAFEQMSEYLGYGLVNLVNIFAPEAIVIGGGVSKAHKFLFPGANKIIKQRALPGMKEHVKLFPAKEPDTMPSLGAVKIAIDYAASL